jgi:hypothetical protein
LRKHESALICNNLIFSYDYLINLLGCHNFCLLLFWRFGNSSWKNILLFYDFIADSLHNASTYRYLLFQAPFNHTHFCVYLSHGVSFWIFMADCFMLRYLVDSQVCLKMSLKNIKPNNLLFPGTFKHLPTAIKDSNFTCASSSVSWLRSNFVLFGVWFLLHHLIVSENLSFCFSSYLS